VESDTLKITGKEAKKNRKIQEPGKQKFFPEVSLRPFKRPEDYAYNTCREHGKHQPCCNAWQEEASSP